MGTIFYRNKAYGGGSGGSSGGGGITRTVLFDAGGGGIWMDSQGKTFDLTDDIDNYDEIEVIAFTMEGDNNYYYTTSQIFEVEDLMVPHVADRFRGMRFRVLVERSTGTDVSIFSVVLESQDPDETAKRTIVCEGASGILGACIHKVIGIKYASGGGGGSNISELTKTEYDALPATQKTNGTLYLVEDAFSEWIFGHSNLGTSYQYTDVPSDTSRLVNIVSLNNVCYCGMYYNYIDKTVRILTDAELDEFAALLGMTVAYGASQTLGGSTLAPTLGWRHGSNTDTLYLDASSDHVGTKCGYSGCTSHLYYRTGKGEKYIYYNDKLWNVMES